eukprot:TRINITY_DN3960_c0_g1_i1.p4 TRINITY_DN3960_c0_g1~~TRINITY_DN3960_c0_g1_i1.p4  ORF type:complete len:136 (-),score=39.49 TRINITY_DN3960_c0_g1_i1:234-641(-)
MDTWSTAQLNLMKVGGNERLKDFFDTYEIKDNSPPEFRFQTKAAIYYRKLLKAEVLNLPIDLDKPSLEEGLAMEYLANQNYTNEPDQQYDLLEIAFEKTIDLTKTAYEKTKSTTTQVLTKTAEISSEAYYKANKA